MNKGECVMEKSTSKKKIKFKKGYFFIIISLIIVFGIGSFFIIGAINKNNFAILKRNYNKYVITKENINIYNSNKRKIGIINEKTKLILTNISNLSKKDKYLKIDGYDYYVFYKDIEKSKEDKNNDTDSYYVDLDINITSNDKVELYKDEKKAITLNNGINVQVKSMDKDYYYINFFNDVYKIKKSKNIKEETIKNKDNKSSDHVSVLYYELIDDNCLEETCLKTASVKAHINKIRDNGFYTITKDDYLAYINGYINLKENAVLLSVGDVNENVANIEKEMNVNLAKFEDSDSVGFIPSNKTSRPQDDKNQLNMYKIKKYFLIDDYVRIAKGEDIIDNGPQVSASQSVPVVNYHFFTNKEKDIICVPYETICLEESYFRAHLDYLKENNYKTLTIHEFSDWMDGIIEIPEKSILITVDDGAKGTGAHNGNILIPVLEEYKMHATLFLIAGWWDIANYQSPYLDIQSHTFDMHGGASNRKILLLNKAEIKEDIKKSLDIIKDNTTFCYPFYEYDNKSIEALQELGVKYAFAGGSRHARRSDNHYKVPRYPIVGDVSKEQFANMIN